MLTLNRGGPTVVVKDRSLCHGASLSLTRCSLITYHEPSGGAGPETLSEQNGNL